MGLFFEIIDFDEEFAKSSRIPTILNDLEENSEKDKEFVNSCIYTRYTSDLLSNIPSCGCGKLFGEDRLGVICPDCNTAVAHAIEHDLEPLIWIRAPEGVPALINPTVWAILSERYTRSKFNAIRYICDVAYNPKTRKLALVDEVRNSGIPRGYTNFIQHFDEILQLLNELPSLRLRKDEIDYTMEFIREIRPIIFSKHIPIINKSILVFEDDHQGNFVDSTVPGIVNAARIMVGIDTNKGYSLKQKENRAIKAIISLDEVYQKMNGDAFLSDKPGLIRKHLLGTRSYFSFRAVVSSITEPHHYREIQIPWGVATSVFSMHIRSILMRRGMSVNEATGFIFEHAQKYSPVLDEIFQMLINTSPFPNTDFIDVHTGNTVKFRGIAATMGRNPSLNVNSIQLVYISKVKTDITDLTVSIPILSVKPLNADFDKLLCRPGKQFPVIKSDSNGESTNRYHTVPKHARKTCDGLETHRLAKVLTRSYADTRIDYCNL